MNKSYWAGHILQFGAKPSPVYDSAVGIRLLILFFFMEGILGPRLTVATWLKIPIPDVTIRIPAMLLVTLILIRSFVGIKFSQIGLSPWKYWSATERWYFFQTLILVNGIFAMMLLPKLKIVFAEPALWSTAANVFLVHLLWGFYQELIYRGILQTECVRRWGASAGICVSNILFTLGPLHFYHLNGIGTNPSHAWIFAAVFAVGLFFGFLFHRSANLWIVGVFHGIGDWYITGLQQVVSTN
jgi:membrane protease YdiL (CAAX protease family)